MVVFKAFIRELAVELVVPSLTIRALRSKLFLGRTCLRHCLLERIWAEKEATVVLRLWTSRLGMSCARGV